MKDEDKQFLGKVLLAIGGGIAVGAIIDAWTVNEEEGSSRETLQDSKTPKKPTRKYTSRKTKEDRNIDKRSEKIPNQFPSPFQPTRYLVEVPRVDRFKKQKPESTFSNSISEQDRKYPENYYSLSKAQQYKYRKRLANQLFQISQERK